MRRTLSIILMLGSGLAFSAPTNPTRYIVQLEGAPAGVIEGKLPVEKGQVRKRRPNAPEVLARRAEIARQQSEVSKAIQAAGGRVKASVDMVLNALIVETTNPNALRGIAGVKGVYQEQINRTKLDRVLALSNVPAAFAQIGGIANAGVGMRIAILDTGIDTTHPGFQDPSLTAPAGFPQTTAGNESLATSKVIVVRSYQDLITIPSYGTDGKDINGHGTSAACAAACVPVTPPLTAGISGVAPKAFLGAYKVLGNDGSGGGAASVKALDDAVKDGMDVINMSLGSDIAGDPATDMQAQAVNGAVTAGAVVCVAAGNAGPDENTINSPGNAETAITVGSSSSDRVLNPDGTTTPLDPNQMSSFSSRGPNLGAGMKPDMVAIGDNFYTAASTQKDPATPYTITQGTSFATPAVAGGVALIKAARPGLTALQYRSLLINSSAPITLTANGTLAPIRWQGAGRMDALAALNAILVSDTTTIKFGTGNGSPSLTQNINLTNLGTAAANVSLTVVPFPGTTAPTLSLATLPLAGGATGQVTVTLAGTGLTGETQGYIVATNDQNKVSTSIPYWYATEGSGANAITLLEVPTAPTAAQPTVFAARVLDGVGLAISDPALTASITSGTGQVLSVTPSTDTPNTYNVTLQLSTGQVVVQFAAGSITRNVTFTVQ